MEASPQKRDRVLREALANRTALIAYARSLLGDYAAAEDVVQESFLVVVRKFDQFEEGTSLLAWCRAIVRLEVLRLRDQRKRERTITERLLDDAADAAFDEFQTAVDRDEEKRWQKALHSCVTRLPARGQNILRARFADDLSYQQIADRLGMTLEAVRKSLFRSKKQVRSCVESSLRSAT